MPSVSREIFLPPDEQGRPVATGFISYISASQPHLIHCWGREDYSDAYDDYVLQFSYDNGATWTPPTLHYKSETTPAGKIRLGEPAAFFDADTGKMIVVINRVLYPQDHHDVDAMYTPMMHIFDPHTGAWTPLSPIVVDEPYGVAVSFCRPIKTSRGRLIFPAQTHYRDAEGKPVHYRGCWSPAGVIRHLLGDYQEDGTIQWHLSAPVIPDLEKTSRGFYEPAMAELQDGRLAMILRGDNSMFPERPGYKWLSFSDDEGESWSEPVPLPCDSGPPLESSSTGSALFRSLTDGALYWIGNLCIDGVRPNGNWPRTPLVIAQIQEEPFALKRDTIFVIDRQRPGEPPQVQHSNFRFYQDRHSGEIVLFLSRYGEVSAEQWMQANYYRYRVALD